MSSLGHAGGISGHGETRGTWKGEPGRASHWQEAKSEEQTSANARKALWEEAAEAHMRRAHILLSSFANIFFFATNSGYFRVKEALQRPHRGVAL